MYGPVGVVLHKQLTSGFGHYTALFAPLLTTASGIMQRMQVLCCIHHECTQGASEHIESISGDPS